VESAITYLNDGAKPDLAALAKEIGSSLLLPLDARVDSQLEPVFDRISREWRQLTTLSIPSRSRQKAHCKGE
jgi:enoyl-[acyl-carrier protein] reductase I